MVLRGEAEKHMFETKKHTNNRNNARKITYEYKPTKKIIEEQIEHKSFSKSVESIKRKQVEQEFQNGKGENKKKKFDFRGEMKKFAQEQNADLGIANQKTQEKINSITEIEPPTNNKEELNN